MGCYKISPAYNKQSRRRLLCYNEKVAIITYSSHIIFNHKTVIIPKCRHENKHRISQFDSNTLTKHKLITILLLIFKHLYYFNISMCFSHLCSLYPLKFTPCSSYHIVLLFQYFHVFQPSMFTLPTKIYSLFILPYITCFTKTFLIFTQSISHYRHHINYAIEPPTISTIFLTLTHFEHPEVLLVNVIIRIFLVLLINKSYIFPHYCIISTRQYCQIASWS